MTGNFGFCEKCGQQTNNKCLKCKIIYYCDEKHRQDDWENHKEKCKIFEMDKSKELGRYLKVLRDIEPGEKIYSEYPILVGPKTKKLDEEPFPCVGCYQFLTEANCQFCPDCHWPCCNIQCDGLKDDFHHGKECEILKMTQLDSCQTFFQKFRFDILILLRSLLLSNYNKGEFDQILNLQNHPDQKDSNSQLYSVILEKVDYFNKNFLKIFQDYMKNKLTITDELIHEIYGIIEINSIELNGAEILYKTTSMIEHNCLPNTIKIIQQNYNITIKAALPLRKDDHLTINYTNILRGTHLRREYLRKSKYFSCSCIRCRDPTEMGTFLSALKCIGYDIHYPCGGIQLPSKPTDEKVKWLCNKCKIKLPNGDVMKFVNHLGDEVGKLLGKQHGIGELEEMLEKLLKFLHPNHYHVYRIKFAMTEIDRDNDEIFLNKNIKICQDLIDINKKLDPGLAVLGLETASLFHKLINKKFLFLSRHCSKDTIQNIKIKELQDMIQETKKILENYQDILNGQKIFQMICNKQEDINRWLNDSP